MASDGNEGSELHNKLVFSIMEYLQNLLAADPSSRPSFEAESLEVALQCLSEAFGLSLSTEQHVEKFSIKPLSLFDVFSLGVSGKQKIDEAVARLTAAASHVPHSSPSPVPSTPSRPPSPFEDDPDFRFKFGRYIDVLKQKNYFAGVTEGSKEYEDRLNKAKQKFVDSYKPPASSATPVVNVELAEKHKQEGNELLLAKKYQEAINSYTEAIRLNPSNAIYYANRAAAYSHLGQHAKAIDDSKASIHRDPKYVKAYIRLGFSLFAEGQYQEALDQGYKPALQLDPTNASAREGATAAQAKIAAVSSPPPSPSAAPSPAAFSELFRNPDIVNLAQSFAPLFEGAGAAPGAPGGGGMPNLMDMINNPSFVQMAQNMMSNQTFANLMNNPAIMNMAQNMMQNPDMLNNMLGSLGGGAFPGAPGDSTEDTEDNSENKEK